MKKLTIAAALAAATMLSAPAQAGCAATAELALDSQAAGALTAVFGAPNLTEIGRAHV